MARPPDDPRVTDLRSYRKAREQAARRRPPKPPGSGLLGSNPRAGLILAVLIVLLLALTVGPTLMRFF